MNELQTFFLTFCPIVPNFSHLKKITNALDAQIVIKLESKEGLRFTGFWGRWKKNTGSVPQPPNLPQPPRFTGFWGRWKKNMGSVPLAPLAPPWEASPLPPISDHLHFIRCCSGQSLRSNDIISI